MKWAIALLFLFQLILGWSLFVGFDYHEQRIARSEVQTANLRVDVDRLLADHGMTPETK